MSLDLSVVIISFNEERIIGKCLEAAQKISKDIIVVDSFSTDRTPEICKTYGVNFHQKEWEGYSSAKNYGNSLAANDLIVSIDADEVLSDELIDTINSLEDPSESYYLDLRLVIDNKVIKYGKFAEQKLRIFNRQEASWCSNFVHETLTFKCKHPPKKVLKGYLYHYSYPNLDKYIDKVNTYTTLHAQQVAQSGKTPANIVKTIFSAANAFIKTYFIKRGFLDGKYGLVLAGVDSFYHFLKYAKTFTK